MKKILLIVVIAIAVVVAVQFIPKKSPVATPNPNGAQGTDAPGMMGGGPGGPGGPGMGGMGGPRRNPLDELKGEDGRVEIAKIDDSKMPEQMKERMRGELTEADADADGFLNEEEQKAFEEKMKERRGGMGGPGMGGPGGPGMGGMGGERPEPFKELKDENGNIDLAKLDEAQAPDFIKDELRKADANADGVIDAEELKAFEDAMRAQGPGMGGQGGPGGPGMGGMGGPGGPGMGGQGGPGAPGMGGQGGPGEPPMGGQGGPGEPPMGASEPDGPLPPPADAPNDGAAE